MADKKEEKSEWEDVLVPLDGLALQGGKKEERNYDNGDLVPLEGFDELKIDPEEYRKLQEKRNREKRRQEAKRRQKEYEEQLRREAEKIRQNDITIIENKSLDDAGEKKRVGKGTIAVLCIALFAGYAIWKGKDFANVLGKNIPATTAQADDNAILKAQLEAEKSAREQAEAAKTEEERKRKEAEAKAAADAAARAEAEQALKKQQEEVAERERKENEAREAEEAKNKEQEEQAQKLAVAARNAKAKKYKVGDRITFGSYPFYEDGSEKSIDWIILDKDSEGNALVISDYALDNVKYNEQYVEITWEYSTIRKWLNNYFINKAFTEKQRSKIIKSHIENKDNAEYNTRGGNVTTDKLFLLSIEEANRYFMSDTVRIAYPTPYAKSNKSVNSGYLYVSDKYVSTYRGGSCWWWLRSPGRNQEGAAGVGGSGSVLSEGGDVNDDLIAIRPAFRINLNNL